MTEDFFTVPQLAEDLKITPRAIRFYESRGLLSPKKAGRTRIYSRKDRARLILIQRGKRLGFSLNDIGDFLDLYDADPTQKEQLTHLAKKIRLRILDLEEQQKDLEMSLQELREIEENTQSKLAELVEPEAQK